MTTPYAKTPQDLLTKDEHLSMSGIEYLKGMLAGRIAHPALAGLLDFHLIEVEPGRAVFSGTASFEHTNTMGAVHGGWYGAVLDTAMGCAVLSHVPKGRWHTTLEYKINITRALTLGTEILCEGLIQHAGRSTMVSMGTIRGREDGRIYATGSTTCIVIEG